MALEQQAHQLAGAAVQPGLAEADRRDPVPADEAAGREEDGDRPAVDRRRRAAGARRRLSAAQGPARASRAVEAQVDVHRQAAADGQRADRPRAHDVRAGHRRHRSAGVERPQPAEHSGAHGGRAAASARRSSRRRGTCSSRPTIRRSSCGSWRICPRTRRCCKAFHEGQDIHRATAARDLRRAAGRRDRRPAPLHQGRQLRPDLRHERVRSRAAARHRARRRAAVHRQVLRALSRCGRVTCSARASRARATATSRRCSAAGCGCPTSRRPADRAARAPNARRSTRRCRAPPPISSSSR